ncbi:MAG: YbaB/EbfC family nucleoid-associated protein [Desulfohalobiaceae bacterium]|nr:YbaB/EbfC family nucleoid-associated protein [Desulfohalobiaceae bacterium]
MQEMMRQAQQMQKKIAEMQNELKDKTVEASSGGGMVTVKATGSQEIREINIDPAVVDPEEMEMLQDLILTATNEALKKAKEMMESEMSKITGGLKIPGIV